MLKRNILIHVFAKIILFIGFYVVLPTNAYASSIYDFTVTQLGDNSEYTNIAAESQNFQDFEQLQDVQDFNIEDVVRANLAQIQSGKDDFSLFGFAGEFLLALNTEKTHVNAQSNIRSSENNNTESKNVANKEKVPHLLIVAGIQGDEPGGFSAASLLATRYTISQGMVTIVPNLNFLAIINRQRGVYGDMNRKFAALDKDDPEYEIVQRIKEMIVAPSIDLVLNLHDGSGFYNPKYISDLQNPNRWGNSIIIDQDDFDAPRYGELRKIASAVADGVNTNLLKDLHAIHVHNTKTADGNEEMAKSLTWFALGKGKPAFGVEASKNLNVAERTYYHLSMLENFFDYVGIEYSRPFELSPAGIQKALSTDIFIGFEDNRFVIPLDNIRRNQAGSIPLSKDSRCLSNSPIITAVTKNNQITVHYGNNYLTSFKVDVHEVDKSIDRMHVEIDGTKAEVPFGTIIQAEDYFLVEGIEGFRVNAIGAVVGNGPRGDESNAKIRRRDFQDRFSIDNAGTTYRVEVYSGTKYVGTFVVQYVKNSSVAVYDPLGKKS